MHGQSQKYRNFNSWGDIPPAKREDETNQTGVFNWRPLLGMQVLKVLSLPTIRLDWARPCQYEKEKRSLSGINKKKNKIKQPNGDNNYGLPSYKKVWELLIKFGVPSKKTAADKGVLGIGYQSKKEHLDYTFIL